VRAALVGGLAVGHRADDGQVIGDLRGVLEELRKLHAGNGGIHRAERPAVFDRGERLGVPGFLMGAAAGQEDVNQILRGCLDWRGCSGLRRLQAQDVAHGKAEAADEAGKKEFAAIDLLEVRGVIVPRDWFDFVHGWNVKVKF
jgi:hypothetical protein